MIHGRILLAIAFCTVSVLAFGQHKSQLKDSIRNLSVQRFQDYFFVWPVLKQRSTSFEFKTSNRSGQSVKFKPNNSVHAGFGMYIFEVGFELTFAMPMDKTKKFLYGNSDAEDIQANVLGKNWGADVFISDYRGFYRDDSGNQPTAGQPYPQRPDVHTHNVGVNGIYIFNPNKFSLRSAFNYSERQRRSGGSFTLTGTFNSYKVTADSNVLSLKYDASFGKIADFHKLGNTTFSLAPGYAYNIIVKSFFFNTSLAVGPAVNWINYELSSRQNFSNTTLNSFIDFRMAIGYNGARFFSGINFVSQSRNIKFETTNFTSSSTTFKMVVGYRFREFGILKKKATDLLFFLDK